MYHINNGGFPSVNQKADFREKATKNITYELDNEGFKGRLRGALKNIFIRDRKLTLGQLILFIMTAKSALQRDLDRFFKTIKDEDFNIREVTKGGFSTVE